MPLNRDSWVTYAFSKTSGSFLDLDMCYLNVKKGWMKDLFSHIHMSNLKLPDPFPVEKHEKIEKKNFQNFWPPLGTPGVPHIWAPRPKFRKPLGYPTQNPLGGYHEKFQSIRSSSFLWRGTGYEKVTWHFLSRVHLYSIHHQITCLQGTTNSSIPLMRWLA